jgi:AmmeMemoRadiSam system protein A
MSDDSRMRGGLLLHIARTTLEHRLHHRDEDSTAAPAEPWLNDRAATFVSLHRLGELRGCVGTLDPVRSLYEDVRHNAVAAALEDSRFPPVAAAELPRLSIEVTLLAPRERIRCRSEREAIEQLRPGIDGVLFRYGERRATFLPQVWETLPSPSLFLAGLKEKAGLGRGFWDRSVVLERYTARSWSESAPSGGQPASADPRRW